MRVSVVVVGRRESIARAEAGLSSMGFWTGEELSCSRMHGSMMINFSPANQRAGNAGLGKLGPPQVMSAIGWEQ